jgi:transcription antitermination factor NusG
MQRLVSKDKKKKKVANKLLMNYVKIELLMSISDYLVQLTAAK